MGTLRGEQIIAQAFKREGVDTIFFMMGGPTGGTAGACLDLGMKGIYVRHEQAAAMMAHAYARVTGKPGICIAPMGPGVANLVTGLGNAWADAAPVIAIGGSAPMRGTTLDTFQEMDQIPMMRPIVKSAYRIDLGYRIPEYISIAFRDALDGKRGPVYLDLPGDVLSGKVEEDKITKNDDSRPAGVPRLFARPSSFWLTRASLSCSRAAACCGRGRRNSCRSSSRRRASRFSPRRRDAESSPRIISDRSRRRVQPRSVRRM